MGLSYQRQTVWSKINENERKDVYAFCDDYKAFLDASKTERLSVNEIVRRAKEKGFKCACEFEKLVPGDKVYSVNKNKNVVLAVIGKKGLCEGMNIVGSHIDSPRLDIKQVPLYEEKGVSLLKTHYYGGIRKYQWVARPLALYGTVVKADGSIVEIAIGDKDEDPVFYITDLLPHLAAKQNDKKLGQAIEGEELNILIGGNPSDEAAEDKKAVKLNVLKLLNEKYGIVEEDFVSAELEAVPAGAARDVGLDRSFISAHGHDDRVCAFTSMKGIFETESCEKTAVALFADKEEIGSVGNTGMASRYFANLVAAMIEKQNDGVCTPVMLSKALASSSMLSADVAAGIDPTFPKVHDELNGAFMGQGTTIVKYTGSRGKGGCSDANAEFVGRIRKLLNDNNVIWQTSELGRVDEGGGGTIAYILAAENMEVLDLGVPVLSMHAPFELVSKTDVYMTYRAYKVFYNNFV